MGSRKDKTLFLKEYIDKENRDRLRWFERNFEKVYSTKPPESVPSKAKVLYEELTRRRLVQQKDKKTYPRKSIETILPKADLEITVLPPMRPVPLEELALLQLGSEAYLLQRYKHSPNDRYYYTDVTSWVCGWGAEKHVIGVSDSKMFGRKNIIAQTFVRRNGVHPDLPYYRAPATYNFDYPFL